MYHHYDPNVTYRILGIDPGTNTLGTGIIDINLSTRRLMVVSAQTFVGQAMASTYAYYSEIHGQRAARLKAHEENLFLYMCQTQPHSVICESPFMGRFAQAYGALVECIASIHQALYRYNPSLPLKMVDPTTVKKATGMSGPLRGKDTVKQALSELDYLHYVPGVNLALMDEHSVDALAVAHVRAMEIIDCLNEHP